jgi:hypothetical protein
MNRPAEIYPISSSDTADSEFNVFNRFAHIALVQAVYYLVTGVWPLVSMYTFQLVTGPKTDLWLVKTVGVLVTVIGAVLLVAAFRRQTILEIRLLAIGSAAGLTGIDLIYVSLGRIPPIYLLDALAELSLITWWAVAQRRKGVFQPGRGVAKPQEQYGSGRSYDVEGYDRQERPRLL